MPDIPPPSRLRLPKLDSPPATILEYLAHHFAQIPLATWDERVARGMVRLGDGSVLTENSPYTHGVEVLYWKEVPSEPLPVEEETILHQDADILVADKPHGMPVTPAGEYVQRSLLIRLQRKTGLASLAPMHRLDRDTAGLVLFCINESTRGRYHQLFAERKIQREYLALAHVEGPPAQTQWRVENRLDAGDPWFRRQIVDGPINAITAIELLEMRGGTGLFRLLPETGKKHQLRVHMASIGFPILGDPLYPSIRENDGDEPPLQLLAQRLSFVDPLSGAQRSFKSNLRFQDFRI